MAEQTDEDSALVERARAGDARAFDLLVRKYQHRVLGLIGRMVSDWSEAQDVAQEVFMRAWRSLGNFRGESSFYTWLYRIAVNTSKNQIVSSGRRPLTAELQTVEDEHWSGAGRMQEQATPENELLRQEMERTVVRTVEGLPEDIRTALTLREVDGLSYDEIAELMQCPIGTVRSRIFRGREAIDRNIKELMP
ncbi:MAG: RNA polymerase sigma factor RpoE [Xanthomonadales bacterium]|nr:RNA polymerase sigma factor RpoE [Xanthomonadales bacterium]MCB1634019.1 RNA polymerase sigma factor RpoE [Xanthomonadales bacterium]MCB1642153.1 RNA polymerase sigma factor RpoE [Xanthomonadales bacterium]